VYNISVSPLGKKINFKVFLPYDKPFRRQGATADKKNIKDFRKFAHQFLFARRDTQYQRNRKLFIYPHLSKSQEKNEREGSAKGWYMRI
jgi:hypothetical protein